jgi:hypothetical protein
MRLCYGCFGCCADAYAAGSEGLSVGQSYTWQLQEDHVFGTSADEEISEKIGSSVNSNSGGGGGSSSSNNSGGSSSISGSLKKRFSLFSSDAGAGKDTAGQGDGFGREGGAELGGSSSEQWFDIAMNFCSEMDLPVRDDVDEDIVREAKSMMKEEGR